MPNRKKPNFDQDIASFTKKQIEAIRVMNDGVSKYVLYGGALGGGKVAQLQALILTPFGFKKCIDLKVGSQVNNPDGTVAKIIQLHPIVKLEKWTVHFHDGTSTDVAADHLWLAWRSGKRRKRPGGQRSIMGEKSARVVETRQLKEWLDLAKKQKVAGKVQPHWPLIPICQEQPFTVPCGRGKQSDLDPYLLGLWLGDGHTSGNGTVGITKKDHEHLVEAFEGFEYSIYDNKTYGFKGDSRLYWKEQLNLLGLWGHKSHEKFIPQQYLWGKLDVRRAVLQGVLDTDGTVDSRGQVYYSTTSKELANNVQFMVQSLGGTATIWEKEPFYRDENGEKVQCKLSYQLYIKHRNEPSLFRLERKRSRCTSNSGNMYRRVVKIEVGGEIEGRCITVDHPNGLYLTNDFIVTHNSYFLRWYCVRRLMEIYKRWDLRSVPVMLACEDYPTLKDRQLSKIGKEFPPWLGRFCGDHKEYGRCYILSGKWGNGIICFRNLDDPSKYNSSEFALICVDELTKNTLDVFTFLRTRLRWPGLPDIECQFLGATNPGGVGMAFCKQFWIDRNFPEEFKRPIDFTKQFAFVPSKAADNPHLDPAYYAQLQTLPKFLRKAYRDGDWSRFLGQAFPEFTVETHVVRNLPIPLHAPIYMTFDWGFGAPFSVGWWYVDADGRLYRFWEWYGWTGEANVGLRLTDSAIVEGIKKNETHMGFWRGDELVRDINRILGPDSWNKKPDYRGGGQGKATAEVFQEHGLICRAGDPNRSLKFRQFHERLRVPEIQYNHVMDQLKVMPGEWDPIMGNTWVDSISGDTLDYLDLNARAREMGVEGIKTMPMMMIYENCHQFIRTIPNIVVDENNIEEISDKCEDHILDDACLICMDRPLSLEALPQRMPSMEQRDWQVITGQVDAGEDFDPNSEATNVDYF